MEENKSLSKIDQEITTTADRIQKVFDTKEKTKVDEQNALDEFTGEKIKLIPNPNFTDCQSLGTLLPVNMANELVSNLSRFASEFNLTDFVREKLGYSSKLKVAKCFSSEQVDALVLAIKSFEKGNAFILGDMAGIGKGRVCAGVLRYAYMQGKVPIFITQKPYLFNSMYKDFMDIDGIGSSDKSPMILPKPFIMHSEGVIIDPKGFTPVPTFQEIRVSKKANQTNYSFVDTKKPGSINEICKAYTEKVRNGGARVLQREFNCVMLPYSVISQAKGYIRRDFLLELAPNSIFVFDECHNAASSNLKANILKYSLPLVQLSKGVLFSSATYAKNPGVFNLYVVKTSLATAVPSLESINSALRVGGENVSEYIASGLVKEGEMIRRERSFSDCGKVTEYVGTSRSLDEDGDTIYTDLPNDKQREFFDEAIGYFKKLRDFTRKEKSKSAINKSVERKALELGLELANYKVDLKTYQEGNRDLTIEQRKEAWVEDNLNKYVPIYTADAITRYKATFRANVFLAIKSKFAAQKIIDCLNTPINYTNIDGTTHTAPMKPIIALANTGEAIFNELKLKEGDMIPNDISEYIRAIYRKLFVGNVTYRKVDRNFLESKKDLVAQGVRLEEVEARYEVLNEDFSDGGIEVQQIQSLLDAYKSQIPFSIIDYLRHEIETTLRSDVYFTDASKTQARYGKADSMFYKLQEGTSRSHMLVKRGDLWEYTINNRIRSTNALFRGFNDGVFDVMLINVVASTGGSAQSSPKEGMDTRPRNMFIVQFELDVNIEVQKRGRINRTGQLNFPTYTYIISKVPVELRTYLMLRKKLRKLDANTSADQTASSKSNEIVDSQNRPIEDIFNFYGYDVFIRSFIDEPANITYKAIFNDLNFRESKYVTAEAEVNEANVEHFNAYIRELELYDCDFQQKFFDDMNSLYIEKKAELISNNEFQEELRAVNYKASIKQRVVRQLNGGSTIFSLPLFIADYYTLETNKPLTLDRVNQKMNDLAKIDGRQVTPEEHWRYIIDDFRNNQTTFLNNFSDEYTTNNRPKREDFAEDADYDAQILVFQSRLNSQIDSKREKQNELLDLILRNKPDMPVSSRGIPGKFIGYRLTSKSRKFKYTEGSVEFVYCFLYRYPLRVLKVSSDPDALYSIMREMPPGDIYYRADVWDKIARWDIDLFKRQIKRFYTGNILSGIVQAQQDKDKFESRINDGSQQVKDFNLVRFTTIDGSITTAVELKMERDLGRLDTIEATSEALAIDCNSEFLFQYASQLPLSTNLGVVPVWNLENDKICNRAIAIVKKQILSSTVLQFEIIKSFKTSVDKDTKRIVYKERNETDKDLYNHLYNDEAFFSNYLNYLTIENTNKKEIKYGLKVWQEYDKDDKKFKNKTKYNTLYVHKKILTFDLGDDVAMQKMNEFLINLNDKYRVMFSFRSNGSDYFNISEIDDVELQTLQSEETAKQYPDGDYEYIFSRRIPDAIFKLIPNVKTRITIGVNGGVILSQPIEPNKLPSYELKPYKIPNNILIQLALSVLETSQKEDFIREIGNMSLSATDSEVGDYVRRYLTSRSVPIEYFFGSLRGSQYGKLFKDNANNLDVSSIKFDEEPQTIFSSNEKRPINLEDAEDYLLNLLKLL
jgi:hypothetical protein